MPPTFLEGEPERAEAADDGPDAGYRMSLFGAAVHKFARTVYHLLLVEQSALRNVPPPRQPQPSGEGVPDRVFRSRLLLTSLPKFRETAKATSWLQCPTLLVTDCRTELIKTVDSRLRPISSKAEVGFGGNP